MTTPANTTLQLRLASRLLLAASFTLLDIAPGLAQTPAPAPPPATAVVPMSAAAQPSFAVATIKPHDPASGRQGFHAVGDRFNIENEKLSSLISFAYSIHPAQLVDAPEWIFHAPFDIDGKPDAAGEPNLRQQQEMLQKLLADRFQLKFHREQRPLSVYAIRVAKSGPKLTPAANPNAQPDQDADGHGTEITQIYTSASIPDLVMGMQFFLDRPLVDQTGLTGRYDLRLRYTYDETHATDPNAPPGLFTAIQEQLGLKLEPVKTPTTVFVIDRVEPPSQN